MKPIHSNCSLFFVVFCGSMLHVSGVSLMQRREEDLGSESSRSRDNLSSSESSDSSTDRGSRRHSPKRQHSATVWSCVLQLRNVLLFL